MRKAKVFVINGFILTATGFAMRAISMVFNLYVANKIGTEAVGVFSLVMSVYMLFITIATSRFKPCMHLHCFRRICKRQFL